MSLRLSLRVTLTLFMNMSPDLHIYVVLGFELSSSQHLIGSSKNLSDGTTTVEYSVTL